MNVTFITWDGPQVSYLEGLFLPIFKSLAARGAEIHIIQFTWGSSDNIARRRLICEDAGASFQVIHVQRFPRAIGPLFSAVVGSWVIRKAIKRNGPDVVIARSTLPALSMSLAIRGQSIRWIFDADGLPLDERVDFAGHSPSGFLYRFMRDVEAQAVRSASAVLVRTAEARNILLARAGARTPSNKFHIVGNGRDSALFRPTASNERAQIRRALNIQVDAPLVVYVGSLGEQYCIVEMLRIFAAIRALRDDAHLLVLTSQPEVLTPMLSSVKELELFTSVLTVPNDAVPAYLASCDLGLALRKKTFSTAGVAPIKLGEYLLSGVPVIASRGVGNVDGLTEAEAYIVDVLTDQIVDEVARWFVFTVLPQRDVFRGTCRNVGLKRFSLESSTKQYWNAICAVNVDVS